MTRGRRVWRATIHERLTPGPRRRREEATFHTTVTAPIAVGLEFEKMITLVQKEHEWLGVSINPDNVLQQTCSYGGEKYNFPFKDFWCRSNTVRKEPFN